MKRNEVIEAMHDALDRGAPPPEEIHSDRELYELWQELQSADREIRAAVKDEDSLRSGKELTGRIMSAVNAAPAPARPARVWSLGWAALPLATAAAVALAAAPFFFSESEEAPGQLPPAEMPPTAVVEVSVPSLPVNESIKARKEELLSRGRDLARAAERLIETPARLIPRISLNKNTDDRQSRSNQENRHEPA